MTPGPVASRGLEINVVIIGVFICTLVVQSDINVAFPGQVFDERLGLENLLNARQLHRLRRFAVGQNHFTLFSGLQRLGLLASVCILLDQ